ncbi:MAG: type II restriction endonuclease subunit M, partial [Planctomycetota bacterium]|nr:type II restriction endonuclease subunit M [Planctomycetota bacterium]
MGERQDGVTMTIFFRLLDCQDKAAALLEQIRSPDDARGRRRFDVDPADFARVPRSPFAYWVSERMRRLFSELPPFESDGRAAKLGLKTDDDFRFVRLWVESSDCGPTWVPLLRGGVSSPFYSDVICLLNWRDSGSEMKSLATARWGNVGKRIFNETFYFRSGLTWPLRGIRFSSQAAPAGCIFSVAGKMAFVPDDTPMSWLAIFNSEPFDRFIAFFAGKVGGVQYEAGLIQRVPVPRLAPAEQATLALLARRAWSLKRSMDTSNETSHAF